MLWTLARRAPWMSVTESPTSVHSPGSASSASTAWVIRYGLGAGLPQMVRQDSARPPRRPPDLADGHARDFATDPRRYTWEAVKPGDPDHMPNGQRLLHVVADRIQWQTALELARRKAAMPPDSDHPVAGRAT